jgi:hypothetical protein
LAAGRKCRINTAPLHEETIGRASWLQVADWNLYYEKIKDGLDRYGRDFAGFHAVLDAAAQHLALPWKDLYFKDVETRRIIGGTGKYGWLGHVFASGKFGHLIANGTKQEWVSIVNAMNEIGKLATPLKWNELELQLRKLVKLGPSMKVWGRELCLVRPDLYCSVSSESVRAELAKTLHVSRSFFETPKGYVELIKHLHGSPWFNSSRPEDPKQAAAWARRVALMDSIFWTRKAS